MGTRLSRFLPFLPSPRSPGYQHRTLDVLSPQGATLDVLCLAYAIPRFGIRNLGSGNGVSCLEAREHWSESRPSIFSWCGRFPLDAEGHGAVGWAYERHGYDEFPDGVCVVGGFAGACA